MTSPELVGAIARRSESEFRPASAEAIAQLQELGLKGDVLEFYRHYEPAHCAEIEDVRLWPIAEVVEENRSYVPGCYLQGHGLVVFATTTFGDAYCFDVAENDPPVVLMSHDVNYEGMSRAQIMALRKPIATSLDAFLAEFAEGTIDIVPLDMEGE